MSEEKELKEESQTEVNKYVMDKSEEMRKEIERHYAQIIPKNRGFNPFSGLSATQVYNSLDKTNVNDLALWLSSPVKFEAQLRELSNMLYNSSGEYKSLLKYFSDMARFYYLIDLDYIPKDYTNEELKQQLQEISIQFSKYNIPHEMSKVWNTVLKEDVFYGYEIETIDTYFILKLDPNYCRIAGISNGMWEFEFDFSYFDKMVFSDLLDTYPNEFKIKYTKYLNDKNEENRWQTLNKSVLFKFNETQQEVIPPIASTFEGLMELKDYKKLKKVSTKIDSYLLLHQQLPLFENTDKTFKTDNFQITSGTFKLFDQMLTEMLPDEIGAFVSPMKIEPIKLDRSANQPDKVKEAMRDIYNSAGVNQHLFNPDRNSTAGLGKSMTKDELLVVNFYHQVARWLNFKLASKNKNFEHWSVKLLPTTGMSEDEYADFLIKLGQLGVPVTNAISALLGKSMTQIDSSNFLETEVFKFKEKFIPFASTHTGGNNNVGGRPEADEDDIAESTQINRDSPSQNEGGVF